MKVPFFRPSISESAIDEVSEVLRSGWLTTGLRAKRFEDAFGAAVGAPFAVAVSSCTAALHLALEALELKPGQAVLVPTMTFTATAEVVQYAGALPIFVDCDAENLHLDLEDAECKVLAATNGELPGTEGGVEVVGMIPVHVGGSMMDPERTRQFAARHGLWVVEDAAHAFPAAWREASGQAWVRCGERTANVTCFSFYANKPITTGEGGMAVTADEAIAENIRRMSLHGLSLNAWQRAGRKGWDYRVVSRGFKYNLSDIAAAIGLHQVERAEELRRRRTHWATRYREKLAAIEELELPPAPPDRIHAWHLFQVRLRPGSLRLQRDELIDELQNAGVSTTVHWRPLHLHPHYQRSYGWPSDLCPVASSIWPRVVSLPLFPSMTVDEHDHVVGALSRLCRQHAVHGT